MEQMINELKNWGCDIQGAMTRMLDDEEFYKECLLDVLNDTCLADLGKALAEHDIKNGFDAAHTLKGVYGNLGLTPMYNKVVEIVEPLRNGSDDNLMEKYYELAKLKEHLNTIVGAND